MGMTWIPKSSIPATLASVVLTTATVLGDSYSDYQLWGHKIQTTAILAIVVCEPIGALLIESFAPRLLSRSTTHVEASTLTVEKDVELMDQKQYNVRDQGLYSPLNTNDQNKEDN